MFANCREQSMEVDYATKEGDQYNKAKIQPVAAAFSPLWQSNDMVTMSDLGIDEADFALLFDSCDEVSHAANPDHPGPEHVGEYQSVDFKLNQKVTDHPANQHCQSHSEQVWGPGQTVTIEDLIKFNQVDQKPLEKRLDTDQTVKALRDIQASNGEQMFRLLDKFLDSHQVETSNKATDETQQSSLLLDELYELRDENYGKSLDEVSSFIEIEQKPTHKVEISSPSVLEVTIRQNTAQVTKCGYRRKREINNQAAKKSRASKKARIQASTDKIDRLTKENPALKEKLINYENELEALKRKLEFYAGTNL